MKCVHGYPYPSEGRNSDSGPWLCRPDGSNPNCPNCCPDGWAESIVATAVESHHEGISTQTVDLRA